MYIEQKYLTENESNTPTPNELTIKNWVNY